MKEKMRKSYFKEKYNYLDVKIYAKDNNLSFAEANKKTKKDIRNKASEYALSIITPVSLTLNRSRLLSIDEKLKKCDCAADLIINEEEPFEIRYTVQYTEDGDLYVKY